MTRIHTASVRIFLLLLTLTGLTAVASARSASPSRRKGNTVEDCVRIRQSFMDVSNGQLYVSLQMTVYKDVPLTESFILAPELVDTTTRRKMAFPLIFVNSYNQQVYFDRYLKYQYPDATALRKKRGKDLDIDFERTLEYEPWMESAVLILRMQDCVCSKPRNASEMVAAAFEKKEAPVINLYPVYLVPPADNSMKVREVHGSAFLCFEVNNWDIKPEYMTNPAELQKIYNSVNLVRSDSTVTIQKMVLEGFASPEGREEPNLELSINRTNALKNYLELSNMARGIKIEATGRGENWEGFQKYLMENPWIPQRDLLLSISNRENLTRDEKEQKMRVDAPVGFKYVLEECFPSLRCTNYMVVYTVRPFTLEESESVFETRPINLSLNEIYRLADKYAQDEERYYAIMRKASLIYPDDSYINLTMAYLALRKRDADDAEGYLAKVKDCPEKTMDEGLVAYLKGDVPLAVELVEQAFKAGLEQAGVQLEEFAKLQE